MSENSIPVKAPPPCYAVLYMALVPVAREHGYALAIHGSLSRDMDLVAIPWTDTAGDPRLLLEAIKDTCEGVYTHHEFDHLLKFENQGTSKPHGRMAYSIHLTTKGCMGPYLDISVMPRLLKVPGPETIANGA